MTKKMYTTPKVISHQAIKFETLISGPTEEEPPTDSVDPIIPLIDIKPGSDPSSYGANSNGRIPVAVLGSANLDVNDIDDSSVRFGDSKTGGALPVQVGIEDFNKDGYDDKVYKFMFQETKLDPDDEVGYLSGKINGVDFVSSSDVNIVGGTDNESDNDNEDDNDNENDNDNEDNNGNENDKGQENGKGKKG